MSSITGKLALALVRGSDYAHAGEEEAIELALGPIAKSPSNRLLDVGCGIGGTARYVTEHGWGQVVGVDIDPDNIAAATARHPDLQFVCSDAAEISRHLTGPFDVFYVLNAFFLFSDQRGALLGAALDYRSVEPRLNGVRLAGIEASRLVFCDGARLRANPWFDWLPLAPTKGEILDLEFADWRPRHIVNGAHWLVPVADRQIRFGATHDHQRLDGEATALGRENLLQGLERLLPEARYAVTGQQAGVRPNTPDRNPLLGQHPRHAALWVCNGFGARGALSIPWYSRQLADHLLQGTPLPSEADIGRWR